MSSDEKNSQNISFAVISYRTLRGEKTFEKFFQVALSPFLNNLKLFCTCLLQEFFLIILLSCAQQF